MKTCLLIGGHKNIENLTKEGLRSWRDVSALRKSTGAFGERDWIWDKLIPLLRDKLIAAGVQVYITDAIYHKETYNRNYDLALALHYDGGGTDSRCMAAPPDSTLEPSFLLANAYVASKDFIEVWKKIYPTKTGITLKQNRVTIAMTQYYVWDYMGENTPSVIIEHGNITCPSDKKILTEQPELIAQADCEAILEFLGVKQEEEDRLEACLRLREEDRNKLELQENIRKTISTSLFGTNDASWERIMEEVPRIIEEKDKAEKENKIGYQLYEEMKKLTGGEYLYSLEDIQRLSKTISEFLHTAPPGKVLIDTQDFKDLEEKANKPLAKYTALELIIEGLKKLKDWRKGGEKKHEILERMA